MWVNIYDGLHTLRCQYTLNLIIQGNYNRKFIFIIKTIKRMFIWFLFSVSDFSLVFIQFMYNLKMNFILISYLESKFISTVTSVRWFFVQCNQWISYCKKCWFCRKMNRFLSENYNYCYAWSNEKEDFIYNLLQLHTKYAIGLDNFFANFF